MADQELNLDNDNEGFADPIPDTADDQLNAQSNDNQADDADNQVAAPAPPQAAVPTGDSQENVRKR